MAATGASDVAAKAGVTAKAAPMAVQASKSDLIEFIVKILRMGAGFICRAPSCSALFQAISARPAFAPAIRAIGH
jgi:hypothetical protein